MSDFLNEIEEEFKQEKIDKSIKLILKLLVVITIISISSVSFYVFQQNKNIAKQHKFSEKLYQALIMQQEGQNSKAEKIFTEILESSNNNYSAIAGFNLAEQYVKEQKIKEAANIYKKISDSSKEKIFSDFARLLYVSYSYEIDKNFDFNADLNQLIKEKNPWYYNALQLKASILIDKNKLQDAQEIIKELANDPKTPKSIAKNANILSSIYRN